MTFTSASYSSDLAYFNREWEDELFTLKHIYNTVITYYENKKNINYFVSKQVITKELYNAERNLKRTFELAFDLVNWALKKELITKEESEEKITYLNNLKEEYKLPEDLTVGI